ncbi:peptide chain release factor N(5)-glutamine methyltransferase [Bacillus tianshenii]|nr:peptide chain release factor N(5)-glutamine methyltransferase [Bacillus tianshenii]
MMHSFSKIFEALNWASSFLKEAGREEEAAKLLLCYHLDLTRSQLFFNMRESFPQDKVEVFVRDVKKYADGTPVQHITGREEFYGRMFQVNPHVLIPRPETEELVQGVLKRMDDLQSRDGAFQLADIGTGSGIIATTMALEARNLDVLAVDISEKALGTAQHNAKMLGAEVTFFNGSFLEPIMERGVKLDILVSNPPYIPREEVMKLEDIVRDHEPILALAGGDDGLDCYRVIISQLPKVMKPNGLIAFEIGSGQGKDLEAFILSQYPKATVEIEDDINGKERMVFAFLNDEN